TLAIEYKGHKDMVRSISTDKSGQYLLSGSDDGVVKIWEVNTGRCLKTIDVGDVVRCVEWCPNSALSLVLIAAGKKVILVNPNVGDHVICSKTDEVLKEAAEAAAAASPSSDIIPERVKNAIRWVEVDDEMYDKGIRLVIEHFQEATRVTWHGKGDYFASVMPEGQSRAVVIHQLSKRRSQLPFAKSKGLVQCVLFHPIKPFLFMATQRHVRIYDLTKQVQVKKLLTNSKWISTMAMHPLGDNLLVGTYDRKML
nr:putative ribosome biogenesis protein BOP1 homolog [Cucujiformia]